MIQMFGFTPYSERHNEGNRGKMLTGDCSKDKVDTRTGQSVENETGSLVKNIKSSVESIVCHARATKKATTEIADGENSTHLHDPKTMNPCAPMPIMAFIN